MSVIGRILYPNQFIQDQVRAQNTHFVDPSSGRLYIRQEHKDLPKFQNLPKELGVEYFDSTGGEKSPSKLRQKIDQIHRRVIDFHLKRRQEKLLCKQHFLFRGLVNLSDWFTGTLPCSQQKQRLVHDVKEKLVPQAWERMESERYDHTVPQGFSTDNLDVRICGPHVREEYVDVNEIFAKAGQYEIDPKIPDGILSTFENNFKQLKKKEQDQNKQLLSSHNRSELDMQIVRRDDKIMDHLARELAPTQLKVKAFQGLLLTAGITSAVAAVVMRYRSK